MKEKGIGYYVPGCMVLGSLCGLLVSVGFVANWASKYKPDAVPLESPSVSVTEEVRNKDTGDGFVVEYTSFGNGLVSNLGEYVMLVGNCVDRALSSFPGVQRTCIDGDVVRIATFNLSQELTFVTEGSVSAGDLPGYVERYSKDKALLEEAGF